jgi:sulfite exporter TauE/SafE/copper chaperone CopZ/plastocyanin
MNEIKIKIKGIDSANDKLLLEAEIDVLKGVKDVEVDDKKGEILIKFDKNLISKEKIMENIKKLGYEIEGELNLKPETQEHTYFVKGMHCASCEVLIEKKLLELKGIKSVEGNTDKGEVLVEYVGERPKISQLNSLFKKENYIFSDEPFEDKMRKGQEENSFATIFIASLLIVAGFLYLNKLGLAGLVNVSSASSFPSFFVLGVLAGFSTCAALVGGIVLSMSKQWMEIYSSRDSTIEKLQPHLMFNVGRIVSYTILGGLLGLLGSRLQVSFKFTSFLVIAISIMMVVLALQMLGVKTFRKFQFTLPKSITRYIADERKFKGKYMPFIMGALTFFLPCGFTITVQSLALLSGSFLQGGLIMLSFVLGTTPALILIGFSSVKFSEKPHLAYKFSRIAGILVLFFALFNINSQLNVLGFSSFSDLKLNSVKEVSVSNNEEGLPPIINGKQVIKMEASAYGYQPDYFKVRVGVPVRWEITDTGTSGCTNAIISKGLFSDAINLTPGQTSIKEFTPTKTGKYKFSCWMGMVSGIIEVVDSKSSSNSVSAATINFSNSNDVTSSGVRSCGCCGR